MDALPGEVAAGNAASLDPDRAELEQYLASDESRLGDVYRRLQRDLGADAIAAELGVRTSTFVWNYLQIIHALLERELPTAPTVALQAARRYRSLLKRNWSQSVRERLTADLERLERRSADVAALVEETVTARDQTTSAEQLATIGIYVYALPHYLRYPLDPESGRTLLKVGHSARDIMQRLRNQTRTTALPEEPILLRIYPTGGRDVAAIETQIHATLRVFDHGRTVERMAGREWFLTTTRALDAVAGLLGLTPIVVNEDVDYVDDA